MGMAIRSTRRFLVRRNPSIVNTKFASSAAYVTPKRIGGRVTPTNTGSTVTPALRSRIRHLDPEQRANPGHDLRRPEDRRDPDNRADHPAPRDLAHRCRDGEADYDEHRYGCSNREREADEGIGPGIEGRGLRENGRRSLQDDGTAPTVDQPTA